MPVPRSASECIACIFLHLAMPKRGPKGILGSHRVFHLLVWVLYTGMQWQGLFTAGMLPTIPEHPRHRKRPKRGRTRLCNAALHA